LKGKVKDITFKGTVDMLKSCALQNGKVPLVSILLCAELADESHMQAVGA